MTKIKKKCPTCNASMVQYKHSLNKGLCVGLYNLYACGGLSEIKDLMLNKYQYNNFQKLRYWGLIKKHEVDGERVGGVWEITQRGIGFLNGAAVRKSVFTYRGEFVEDSGKPVYFTDMHGPYKKRDDYNKESRAHHPKEQVSFL